MMRDGGDDVGGPDGDHGAVGGWQEVDVSVYRLGVILVHDIAET